jgi:hypothetical protein
LNFRWKETSDCFGSGTIEKLDPENRGIAVGISSLSHMEVEICLGVVYPLSQVPAYVAKI